MTHTQNPHEELVIRMPRAAAKEILAATEFVSWENDDFQQGVKALQDVLGIDLATDTEATENDEAEQYVTVDVSIERLVTYDELSDEDREVPESVKVLVLKNVPEHLRANAALDIFHVSQAIDCLEHFEVTASLNGSPLVEAQDHESYSLSTSGVIASTSPSRVRLNTLAVKFLDAFESADAIEVDGHFFRHYDNFLGDFVVGYPDELLIELSFDTVDGELDLNISVQDLNTSELDEEGHTWTIGGREITFHTVKPVATNPVNL